MPPEGSSQKIEIVKTLITVAGSIVVALIGAYFYYRPEPPLPVEKCDITGTVTFGDHKPLKNAEIYLIRATGNENMQMTDDNGKFSFDRIPLCSYWIVVRDNDSAKSSRVLIEAKKPGAEIPLLEARLKYQLFKE